MGYEDLENQIDFLLRAAMRLCGDMQDAQDLTQETLLAALAARAKGREIQTLRPWLLAVLRRKYNDLLRRRCRQSTVSIGEAPDLPDEGAAMPDFEEDEAARVRQAVAYLAESFRQVVVRHYMEGQSVRQIAAELGLSEGTVKSRLRLGRERMRREIDNMEKYEKQSYAPVTLNIDYCGSPGINGEPFSLVENDLLAQNLLWLAYPKPVTVEELAQAVGVPTAYVEPVVRRLIDGALMKRAGAKVYTDFMIVTPADQERTIPRQKACVRENFHLFWGAVGEELERLRRCAFYQSLTEDEKYSLELYTAFHCLDYGVFEALSKTLGAWQEIPDRPNAGRWIAIGRVKTGPFDTKAHAELLTHSYSGERTVKNGSFGGTGFELHAYGAEGFPGDCFYASPDYTFFPENSMIDPEIAKLLTVLRLGLSPEREGFNPEVLKAVPWLTRCKVLREENGKPAVNVPVLSQEEAKVLWDICARGTQGTAENLRDLLRDFLRGKELRLPAHLTGVPPHKQYMYATNAMLFATVREAMSRGRLHDGHYDAGTQYPCPMVLIL